MSAWYSNGAQPDRGLWWWAVEHLGHPAFYLRTLMAGDFAPGRLPLDRHVGNFDGLAGSAPVCGTCGRVPVSADLEVVERATGDRDHLRGYRQRRAPWPRPTDPRSCWLCSDPRVPADREVRVGAIDVVKVCAGCQRHWNRAGSF